MNGDVSRVCGDNALVMAHQGRQHRHIGLGPSHQELHVGIRILYLLPDQGPCPVTVFVHAVARRLVHIGFTEPLKDLFMSALQIVTVKHDHSDTPPPKAASVKAA